MQKRIKFYKLQKNYKIQKIKKKTKKETLDLHVVSVGKRL